MRWLHAFLSISDVGDSSRAPNLNMLKNKRKMEHEDTVPEKAKMNKCHEPQTTGRTLVQIPSNHTHCRSHMFSLIAHWPTNGQGFVLSWASKFFKATRLCAAPSMLLMLLTEGKAHKLLNQGLVPGTRLALDTTAGSLQWHRAQIMLCHPGCCTKSEEPSTHRDNIKSRVGGCQRQAQSSWLTAPCSGRPKRAEAAV